MILSEKFSEYLYQMATCEDRVKSKRRERERGKERNGLVE
jgi:hypothetical protein